MPDLEDRRVTWLDLTPKAERLFERLWGMGAVRIAGAVARLLPNERADLRRLLARLAENLQTANNSLEKKVTA